MKIIRKLLLILLLIVLVALILFVGLDFVNYVKTTNEASISKRMEEIENRKSYATYDETSGELLQATITIEDRHFYEHYGVEYRSVVRALYQNMLAGQVHGGGSTIIRQLAKSMHYTYQLSYSRRVNETFTAYDPERELSKKGVLELYVNMINYGDSHVGTKVASEGYFHKEPKDLTLDEATLLVGLPQSLADYQLSNHESTVRNRQIQAPNAMTYENMTDEQRKTTVMKQMERQALFLNQ